MKKLSLFLFIGLIMASCSYEYPEIEQIDVTDTISFQEDVIPIFEANCTSCHPGSHSLDLTAANAYSELNSNNLIYLDDPEASKIYDYIYSGTNTHSWKKYSDQDAQTILVWITQGALNN